MPTPGEGVPRESEVLAQVLQLLTAYRIFHWRQNVGGGHRGNRYVRFGVPGVSDVLAVANSRFIAIEVKRPGGKLTHEQRGFLNNVTVAGGLALVVSDVRQLETALRLEGVIP